MNSVQKNAEIIIFASGAGTTLEALIQFFNKESTVNICAVIADRPCHALARAKNHRIPAYLCDKNASARREHFYDIDEIVQLKNPALLVLAGFLGILPRWFTSFYAQKIINVHPSLLPAYGGKGMYGNKVHRAVLAAGEKISGCTVHWVSEVIDGGAIIDQQRVRVEQGQSIESLASRVQAAERELYPRVITSLLHAKKRRKDA